MIIKLRNLVSHYTTLPAGRWSVHPQREKGKAVQRLGDREVRLECTTQLPVLLRGEFTGIWRGGKWIWTTPSKVTMIREKTWP